MVLKNKRGMFFVIMTLIIISIFAIGYLSYYQTKKDLSLESRIETLNYFVSSIEEDIPRHLHIAGYRFLFISEKHIFESGQYLQNVSYSFQEAFYNGTFMGSQNNILQGATFNDIVNKFQEQGNSINANVSFLNPEVRISQNNPWYVNISLKIDLLIQDLTGLVQWNRTKTFSTLIPIENFEDPIYIVKTEGKVVPKINKTIYEPFVTGTNLLNLTQHLLQMRYIESSRAPSFLNRLEGKLEANENGIESLVNLAALSGQGIPTNTKSVVDYIYFSDNNPQSCNVQPQGMPSWFRLDNESLTRYGLSCA